MATGHTIRSQIPILPASKCELCGENDIIWKCFTCTTRQHMCNTCAEAHLKSELFKNHRVTSIKDSEKRREKHTDHNNCKIHPNENVQIYCKSCEMPICHDCLVSGSHQHHKLVKCDVVMETKHKDDRKPMDISGQLELQAQNIPQVLKKLDTARVIPTEDVQIIKRFSVKDIKEKNIMASVSDDMVWMGLCWGTEISLVTINGNVVQTVNTHYKVNDLAVTKSGDVLVTVHDGNKVMKLMSDNTFTHLYIPPDNYETLGITVADNNTIIVGLHHRNGDKVVELSSSGQLINTIQYQSSDQTPLFDYPWRVSCNRNGDLVVIHNSTVVAIDKAHNKIFTYTGQGVGLKETFGPRYIVTDQYGHILISDYNNNVVHILDSGGDFIKYIRTDEYGVSYPYGMCIDNIGRLWVCAYWSSKVMIIKYI